MDRLAGIYVYLSRFIHLIFLNIHTKVTNQLYLEIAYYSENKEIPVRRLAYNEQILHYISE